MKMPTPSWIVTVSALSACGATVTAGCDDQATREPPAKPEEPADDDAPDDGRSAPLAHQDIQPGAGCDEDGRQVPLPGRAGDCGLNGFECRKGTWKKMVTYCNPPPPERLPSATPSASSTPKTPASSN